MFGISVVIQMVLGLAVQVFRGVLVFGDFNEILAEYEKTGGDVRGEQKMDVFQDAVDCCLL